MKLKIVLFFSFLIYTTEIFTKDQNKDQNLYFCTVDLQSKSSYLGSSNASIIDSIPYYYFGNPQLSKMTKFQIAAGITSYGKGSNDNILISSGIKADDVDKQNKSVFVLDHLNNKHNITFRHCFLMRGESTNEVLEQRRYGMNETYHLLKSKNTIGFYGDPKSEFGANYSQENFKSGVYSCQKIKSFTLDDSLNSWTKIEKFFALEKEKGYDPVQHNCCSVAYDALQKLVDEKILNTSDLNKIDKQGFNLGLGIKYRFDSDNLFFNLFISSSSQFLYYTSPNFDTSPNCDTFLNFDTSPNCDTSPNSDL